VLLVVSLPVQFGQYGGGAPGWLLVAGGVVWLTGFVFESVGDWQLRRFSADPHSRGKVLDTGLWRYTRHPNYFGDAVMWWGIGLLAVQVEWGWTLLVGPLLMTFLLLRVSGIALLEQDLRKRKPEYEDYVRRTNAFIPGPPKSGVPR
jgi:steroid 5-alpha reductase family enzyme